ncbi:hypothetical protein C4J90_3061 [Pseudomonas sp. R2-60-08W]|nr:hypothetical protein C4J90_3061 [Pseudomonas sp. R2-60-08W]
MVGPLLKEAEHRVQAMQRQAGRPAASLQHFASNPGSRPSH